MSLVDFDSWSDERRRAAREKAKRLKWSLRNFSFWHWPVFSLLLAVLLWVAVDNWCPTTVENVGAAGAAAFTLMSGLFLTRVSRNQSFFAEYRSRFRGFYSKVQLEEFEGYHRPKDYFLNEIAEDSLASELYETELTGKILKGQMFGLSISTVAWGFSEQIVATFGGGVCA